VSGSKAIPSATPTRCETTTESIVGLPRGRELESGFAWTFACPLVRPAAWVLALAVAMAVELAGAPAVAIDDKVKSVDAVTPSLFAELTIDAVQLRAKKLEETKDLDAALRAKLAELYAKILDQLKAASEASVRGEQFSRWAREAPETLRSIKNELSAPTPASTVELAVADDAPLSSAQQTLSKAESALAESQKLFQQFQDEPKKRADRRLEIPKLAEASKLQLQEIDKLLEAKPSSEESVELASATRWLLEARRRAIQTDLAACQQEAQFYEVANELLSVQRDRAARRAADAETQVATLRGIVNDRRRREAEKQGLEAKRTAAQSHLAVRRIADTNSVLALQRQNLARKIESAAREFESVDRKVLGLEEQVKKVKKRIETAGSTEAIGLLLRKQRDDLPDVSQYHKRMNSRAVEISNAYLELIESEEHRNGLATLDAQAKEIAESFAASMEQGELQYLEAEVRAVLEAQRSLTDSLIADTSSYLEKLVELDVRERQLVNTVNDATKYCDERILWIRSSAVFNTGHMRAILPALEWLSAPQSLQDALQTLAQQAQAHSVLVVLSLAVTISLLGFRRRLLNRLTHLGEQASRSNATSMLITLRAACLSALLALAWPVFLGAAGCCLAGSEHESEYARAVGHGLLAVAWIQGTVEYVRLVCRKSGLGESHFGWPVPGLQLVRGTLRRFLLLGLPMVFVVGATEHQSSEWIKNSLGRGAFILVLMVLTGCMHQLLRPRRGLFEATYALTPETWFSRMKRAWHLLGLALPLSLTALACAGYYFTALELAWRFLASLWLLGGTLVVHGVLLRWVLISHREMAIRNARERRATVPQGTGVSSGPHQTVLLADISKHTRQSLQIGLSAALMVGLWFIWVNVLPALGALRRVELWVVESTRLASGPGNLPATISTTVTLADLLLAVLVAALTLASSRNLPSLFEFTILRRLPLDPGARYAITRVCRYLITASGIILSFGAVGIGWSKVQWLLAAISVGLGFGLQEIFANFVSGLILLFERPVRLGDIVTIGDNTGTVTRIQMRATTITDAELREVVVPNRELVTGRIMNWTLSNTVSRMTIRVNTPFESDPDRIRQILLDVASRHSLVLKEPKPLAMLDEFGACTYLFSLHVFLATREVYAELRHELHCDIAREFKAAGIELAFPQQDIRVRTMPTDSASTIVGERRLSVLVAEPAARPEWDARAG